MDGEKIRCFRKRRRGNHRAKGLPERVMLRGIFAFLQEMMGKCLIIMAKQKSCTKNR
ncbi:MAG: hypothetical protein ALAOOOJD_01265 [bacterium]|nr:hypothetical protein [bacterium]